MFKTHTHTHARARARARIYIYTDFLKKFFIVLSCKHLNS